MIQAELNFSVPTAARKRLSAKRAAILQRLQQGPAKNTELFAVGGIRYGARIGELRNAGYDIVTRAVSEERGIYEYVLRSEV